MALGITSCSNFNYLLYTDDSFINKYNDYEYAENNVEDFVRNTYYTTNEETNFYVSSNGYNARVNLYGFELFPKSKNYITFTFAASIKILSNEENLIYSYVYTSYKIIDNRYFFNGDTTPSEVAFIKAPKNVFRIKIFDDFIDLIPETEKRPL